MRSALREALVVVTVIWLAACQPAPGSEGETAATAPAPVADKAFVAGGKMDLDLDGGAYEIKPATDNHIRVATNSSTATVDVTIDGSHADVKVRNAPQRNFHAIIEVPAATDVVIRLTGGELKVDAISGNKDVESYGGNVQIAVADPNQYAHVDAAVKAGDIDARPFGGSKSGLMQEFTWSGGGKYTLRAHLGAGSLVLGSK